MFGKCVLVILAVGATGCTLLALRQSRLQAASEMVRIQLDIREQDEELWLLRTQIAQQVTPDQVRQMMSGVGPLEPMVPARNAQAEAIYDGSEPAVPRETPGAPSGNGPARRPALNAVPAPKPGPETAPAPATRPGSPRVPAGSAMDRRFATQRNNAEGER